MAKANTKVVDELAEAVTRAQDETYSEQPRFEPGGGATFGAFLPWINTMDLEIPTYRSDSRTRDKWLRTFWTVEPHWQGVVKQVVMIDSNRGWTMIGGRNQVNRYTAMCRNAENGAGWRTFQKKAALSYRIADMCTVIETGRDGEGGPLRAIYNVDPTRCKLTGNVDLPLSYYPATGKDKRKQDWTDDDFFRVVNSPTNDETFYDLGYCATSMAFELVKLMYAVLMHDQEMAGARMPEGLMLLQGIGLDQWRQALESRKEKLDADMRRFFGGIMVLASTNQETINAKLVALSQLPANFDRKVFIDMTLYAYALIVGYAPGEFWPVQFGALGRGKEEETQALRATSKGGLDYVLSFQDRFQMELPDSLHFEFEQRSEAGQLLQAEVFDAWGKAVRLLAEPLGQFSGGIITPEQALVILVEQVPGVIPPEWTEQMEETQTTDTDDSSLDRARERARTLPAVLRASQLFPDEPIIEYMWGPFGEKERVLWARGDWAYRHRHFQRLNFKRRQEGEEVLYRSPDGEVVITEADVNRAVADGERRLGLEFAELLEATTEEEPPVERQEEDDESEEDVAPQAAAPQIVINVPEQPPPQVFVEAPRIPATPVDLTIEVVSPDEVIETDTVVERDQRTGRIVRTDKYSRRTQ